MSDANTSGKKTTASFALKKTRSTVNELRKIDLIGHTAHKLTGSKLPSKKQVLMVSFSQYANRIPTQFRARCIDKIIKLYIAWLSTQKKTSHKRTGQSKAPKVF